MHLIITLVSLMKLINLGYSLQEESTICAPEYGFGCYKGRCWAYCPEVGLMGINWCYLIANTSSYVECDKKSDCNRCWQCGGQCKVIDRCAYEIDYGCYQGFCWSGCTTFGAFWNGQGEWCYTSKTFSQSYRYVKCSTKQDCNPCWSCAGPCTLFPTK